MSKLNEHPKFPGLPAFEAPQLLAVGVQPAAFIPSVAFSVNDRTIITVSPGLIVASGDMKLDQVAMSASVAFQLPADEEEAKAAQILLTPAYIGAALGYLASSGILNVSRLACYSDLKMVDLKIHVDAESLHRNDAFLMYFALLVLPSTIEEAQQVAKTNMELANSQFTALNKRLLEEAALADTAIKH